MVDASYSDKFVGKMKKCDLALKERVKKQIIKIGMNPEIGKPMQHERKGTREVYMKPYRLSYAYLKDESKIIILDLYHKDEQ